MKPRYRYRLGWRSLRKVCPTLTKGQAKQLAVELAEAMIQFEPDAGWDAKSASDFVAQCAHESGEFRYVREIWGPSSVQRGYWRRRDLGNWLPSHGYTFRGAGWIQTTGRANFKRAAAKLGIRLETLARRANQRRYASLLAAIWWQSAFPKGTAGMSVEQVTRRVNGGTNGLAERRVYTARARANARYLIPKRRSPR